MYDTTLREIAFSQLPTGLLPSEESGALGREVGLAPRRQHQPARADLIPDHRSVRFVHPMPSARRAAPPRTGPTPSS